MPDEIKILAVDDEPDCTDFVQAILEAEGYTVITRSNGRECVEAARTERPDLIVSDVMMPEMDGYEAVEELKADESTESIPVILLTGVAGHVSSSTYSHRGGMETEADDYIPKPIDPEALVQAVKRLLRQAGKEQAS